VAQQTPIIMLGSTLNITGMTNCSSGKSVRLPVAQTFSIHSYSTNIYCHVHNKPHWSLSVSAQATDFLKIILNIIFQYMFRFCSWSVPVGVLTLHCVSAVFRREADDNCVLLGCYAVSSGNFVTTFRDKTSDHFQESRFFWILDPWRWDV
jgi:hypothetical protein